MKKIKVRIKPKFKGFDLCHTVYKLLPKKIDLLGKVKYRYIYNNIFSCETVFVGVIEYENKNYFLVKHNDKITRCIEM